MDTSKITAKMFRYTRRVKGFSQARMALALGVNQSSVSRIEKEEISPALPLLRKIQKISGLTLEELVRASVND